MRGLGARQEGLPSNSKDASVLLSCGLHRLLPTKSVLKRTGILIVLNQGWYLFIF